MKMQGRKIIGKAILVVLGMAIGAGSSLAAEYQIKIKDASGSVIGLGGFGFNKAGKADGSHEASSVNLQINPDRCDPDGKSEENELLPDPNDPLRVWLVSSTLLKAGTDQQDEPLFQGSNVEGLTGSLVNASGTCKVTFSLSPTTQLAFPTVSQPFVRTYNFTNTNTNDTSLNLAGAVYAVQNTALSVPEPAVALLILVGAGAMFAARRRRET